MFAEILFLIAISFAAPVIYLVIIRNSERYERERWSAIKTAFLWGALPAAFLASMINTRVMEDFGIFVAAVLVAPFVEELIKPIGILQRVKGEVNEVEDGIIFGVACAMGFAAVENVAYMFQDLEEFGGAIALSTVIGRSISAVLLHASATAFTGYGIAKAILAKRSVFTAIPYYLVAVFLHGAYNFIVSIGTKEQYFENLREVTAEQSTFVSLVTILLTVVSFSVVYIMVRRAEETKSAAGWD